MSPLPGFPLRPPWKRWPSPEPSFTPPGSPNRAPIKTDAPFLKSPCHYLSQFPISRPPTQVPQRDLYGDTLPQNLLHPIPLKIHISLRVPSKGAPSMIPNGVPMDRDTPSPEPLSIYLFIHICLPQSPKMSPPTYGEKHKVTVHRAPCRW